MEVHHLRSPRQRSCTLDKYDVTVQNGCKRFRIGSKQVGVAYDNKNFLNRCLAIHCLSKTPYQGVSCDTASFNFHGQFPKYVVQIVIAAKYPKTIVKKAQ
jgi:hypothetical protein